MISFVVISPDDSEGVVLAEVMEAAKEIRSGDKKRVKSGVKTPIVRRSGWRPGGCWAVGGWSGRRCGLRRVLLLPAAGLSGCLGGNYGEAAAGEMVCRGWLGRAMIRRQFGCI